MESHVSSRFAVHDKSRITQGDILRDLTHAVVEVDGNVYAIDLPYAIVVTQDCDLEQAADSIGPLPAKPPESTQFLPNVTLLPCFPGIQLREGEHLKDAFNIVQPRINSDRWKLVRQNLNPRYHFLSGVQTMQVPDLAIDFKLVFSIPSRVLKREYPNTYLATLNELFREDLSQRYCSYASRIGLPVIVDSEEL